MDNFEMNSDGDHHRKIVALEERVTALECQLNALQESYMRLLAAFGHSPVIRVPK